MRVEYLVSFSGPDTYIGVGDERDVDDAFGNRLIARGFARPSGVLPSSASETTAHAKSLASFEETASIGQPSRAMPMTGRKRKAQRAQ